jgi:alpha-methylacyl-CoA racemase
MGPLQGIRVVEFSGLGAAPYGVMLLADLGADVVRIDRPDAAHDPSLAGHLGVARGRRSITLDLKHQEAAGIVDRLVAGADVLVEGFRPGVMERLGLGPDVLLERHSHLVYARMTGFGQDGPLAHDAGHDINYAALAGALHPVGVSTSPPSPAFNALADLGGGGAFLAIGVLAALVERASSGRGQVLDVAMIDGAASLTGFIRGLLSLGAWSDERESNLLDGAAPFYATYACADGRFVAVGAIEPAFYAALLEGLGLDPDAHPQHDRGGWVTSRAAFATAFAAHERSHWELVFGERDACVTPVLSLREAAGHAHHRARATFVDVPGVSLPLPAPAPRLSRTPGAIRAGAPVPGADTFDVLSELGYDPGSLVRLAATGVLGDAIRTEDVPDSGTAGA